jgi:phytoene dehydrogenase-like protein
MAVRVGGRGSSEPDAVIVGAGHNGLVAANLLADAGWDVVLCEAADEPGGAVRSAEVTVPGFISDLFSAFYPLGAASPVLSRLELADHGLTWSHAPLVLAHVFPDGRTVSMSRDIERTAESVSRFSPRDGSAWRGLVRQWDAIEADFLEAIFRPFPPLAHTRRLVRTLGIGDTARLARTAVLSVRRFGEEHFAGEGAALLVAGSGMHADVVPDGAGSGAYAWLMSMVGQRHGFPVPRGGAGELPRALASRLATRGADLRLRSPVERILTADGAAVGVRLESGERILARRAVIADVNAPMLYDRLLGHDQLPARFVDDLQKFQWDAPTLKINWALSQPIPWEAVEVRDAGTIHLGADMDGLTSFAAALARREIPPEPFIILGQMTTADATRSPSGTESAWGYTHLPAGREFSEDDIAAHVGRVEAVIERHAPGFSATIVGRHVQSPRSLQAENPNLWGGAVNGGTAQLHQQLVFRPTIGFGGALTPVDRLFLGSSSAHPGGGVHGGPGSNAARAALKRAGHGGRIRRRVVDAAMSRLYKGDAQGDGAG